MEFMTILAVAMTMAQAEPTFEQRWQPLTPLHRAETSVRQRETIVVQHEEPKVRHHRAHRHKRAHHATGCRFGKKVYTHGKSWRCRR